MWEQHFRALQQYKQRYGDCNVPKGWMENDALAGWVHDLRRRRRASVQSGIKDGATLTQSQVSGNQDNNSKDTNDNITSLYGSSCANNDKGAPQKCY
eukprot:9293952-Pyramimonas_sp.AAC.1